MRLPCSTRVTGSSAPASAPCLKCAPFSTEGIDFAMTALFVVIMVEQWMEKQNRPSVVIGLVCGLVCRLVFGADNFILPTMICVMVILLSCKKIFDKMIPEDGKEGGEPECQ